MRLRTSGQALVELAVVLPLLLLVALGGVEFARLALARTGLDAATAAAAASAARAPDAATASKSAGLAFAGVAGGYGLNGAQVTIAGGSFQRGGRVTATGRCTFALGFSGVPALRAAWSLRSSVSARIEDWRSR